MDYFESAQLLFDERYQETDLFLSKVAGLVESAQIGISRENEHVIKSNVLLMQYNILESVFLELYKCFYLQLKVCQLSLDNIKNQSFIYSIYSMIKRAPKKRHEHLKSRLFESPTFKFSDGAMSMCFDLDEEEEKFLVNGNLDGRKIKEFLSGFGVDISNIESLDLHGLKTLKDNRQLLAHGGSSFSAVGKNISWSDLRTNLNTIKNLFNESKKSLDQFCTSLSEAS